MRIINLVTSHFSTGLSPDDRRAFVEKMRLQIEGKYGDDLVRVYGELKLVTNFNEVLAMANDRIQNLETVETLGAKNKSAIEFYKQAEASILQQVKTVVQGLVKDRGLVYAEKDPHTGASVLRKLEITR